jgi:rSAM/selenodomain-associated transferase 1
MSRDGLLMIFVKNPVLGRVKTRLAAETGDERALQIYQALLRHTRAVSAAIDHPKLIYYSDFLPEHDLWAGTHYHQGLQPAGDLGQRMATAFRDNLQHYQRVVIIGADDPDLQASHLATAFEQLQHHDLVIGPATDGGYYLLGMTAFHPTLFQGIAWSTDQVRAQTLKQASEAGLSHYLLPEHNDIDTYQDWLASSWQTQV